MSLSTFCAWDSHENCNNKFCQCECHVQGREEWVAWQDHIKGCQWCREVVAGLRLGRCHTGDILVAAWYGAIHVPDRRD